MSDELIITGSFNGLLRRFAEVDQFNVWYEWSKARKLAKKQNRTPTIKMSEVQEMTGLAREDLELFTSAVPIIEIVAPGADPLVSFSEVYCLLKIFERMADEGNNCPKWMRITSSRLPSSSQPNASFELLRYACDLLHSFRFSFSWLVLVVFRAWL